MAIAHTLAALPGNPRSLGSIPAVAADDSAAAGPGGAPGDLHAADWLGTCRRVVDAQRGILAQAGGISGRTVYEGVGEGGDRALEIDRRCEDAVFAELEALHTAGHDFTAVSEERGEVAFGDPGAAGRVVIDPIDGSLNARRMIPSHCLSVAVASGPAMADVEFGYVYDFGAGEEFVAGRGEGARLDERPLRAEGPGHGLEVVGIEGAEPGAIAPVLERLEGRAFRIRAIGAIALALSYVAAGRFDAMLASRACRSVDAAAGQLIAREAGAIVAFEDLPLHDADLGLGARYRVTAAAEAEWLGAVRAAIGLSG
jgi:myo-inositol-1(or 4)-monophosphatase